MILFIYVTATKLWVKDEIDYPFPLESNEYIVDFDWENCKKAIDIDEPPIIKHFSGLSYDYVAD